MSSGSFESSDSRDTRIRKDRVQLITAPIVVALDAENSGSMVITPVLRNRTIHSIGIRCSCGRQASIECVYEDESGGKE